MTGRIEQAESHFGQAGPFTETVLLGVIAQQNPDTELEWDSKGLQFKGRSDLDVLVKRDYAKAWKIEIDS